MKGLLPILTSLWIVTFSFFSKELEAQNPRFHQFTLEDGLSGNEVYHILQDSKGYLWFSTDRGVSRYDGSEFLNLTSDDGLISNTIYSSYEDEKGRIWFLGNTAELCYWEDNLVKNYIFNSRIRELTLTKSPIVSIQVLGNEVFVGTNSEGYFHVDSSGDAHYYNEFEGLEIVQTNYGPLIYRYQSESEKVDSFLSIKIDEEVYKYSRKPSIICRILESNTRFYFSDGSNLFEFESGKLTQLLKTNQLITSIFEDDLGVLWTGSLGGGVKGFERKDGVLHLKHHFLKNESVSWITRDFEGGVWYSTLKNGVFYRPANSGIQPSFEKELPQLVVKDIALKNDSTAYVSYSDGSIWLVSSSTQAEQIDSSGNNSKNEKQPLACNIKGNKLYTPSVVRELFNRHNNQINDSIRQLNTANSSKLLPVQPEINSLLIDSSSALWVGTGDGLYKFHNETITSVLTGKDKNSPFMSGKLRVDAMEMGKNMGLYLATLNGVYLFDGRDYNYLGERHPLLKGRVDVIKKYDQNTMMFGSRGKGLILLRGDNLVLYGEREGLGGVFVNTIDVLDNGQILAGTEKGLFLIDLDTPTKVKRKIGAASGLLSDYITKISVQNQFLWVGTSKGLSRINLKNLEIIQTKPVIHIDSINTDDNNPGLRDEMEIEYSKNNLTINFTGISYRSLGELKYAYILEGLEGKWRETVNRSLRFNTLPPGNYNFKVKAFTNDGIESEIDQIHFTVKDPFWKTWWFISLMLLIVVVIILLILRGRETRLKEQLAQQKLTIELELKALRAQMNPHFTFNTLSSIQQYILENDRIKASDYLSRFASLIRKVLENSRHPQITLKQEIETLQLYLELEKLRFPDKFDYSLKVGSNLEPGSVMIPPSILQPFVENAIIHGIAHLDHKGFVEIVIQKNKGYLHCIISDNGVGRKKAGDFNYDKGRGKRSLGLEITGERLNIMDKEDKLGYKYEINDSINEEGEVAGTRVDVFLPLNQSKYYD